MINPHVCYIIGFVFSLAIYRLGWSEIYPQLSAALVIFLITSIFEHFIFSWCWNKTQSKSNEADSTSKPKLNPRLVTLFIYCIWAINFIHEGGIPLYNMLAGIYFDYKLFGTPVLHVFAVSFTSFYCGYLFQFYLRSRNKEVLFLYFINMTAAVLICSRSMLFFNMATSFFLYLLHQKKLSVKKLVLFSPIIILLFYLFGVAGTIRVSFEAKVKYDQQLFLDNGKATTSFRNSIIPKEFFWSYIYISSPLANLQVNINTFPVKPITIRQVLLFINNEWFFESLSKRINKLLSAERENENTVKYPFNVSTVYSRSYSYAGWIGMIATGIFVLALPMIYRKLLKDDFDVKIGVGILCTAYLFLSYDNTIRLMGVGFQLVYPIVFPFIENKLGEIKLFQ